MLLGRLVKRCACVVASLITVCTREESFVLQSQNALPRRALNLARYKSTVQKNTSALDECQCCQCHGDENNKLIKRDFRRGSRTLKEAKARHSQLAQLRA